MKRNLKIEKVMLVYPNQRWLKVDLSTTWNLNPYTICLLGTMIKDDVDLKIVDAQFYNICKDEFRKNIEDYDPDLIGISLLSTEYDVIGDIAAGIAKDVNKDIIVVVGGAHVTSMYLRVLENNNFDYAVRGEGEYAFRDLIRHFNEKGPFPEGVIFRKPNGELHIPLLTLVRDLDALPYPDYELVDFSAYSMNIQRYGIDVPAALPFVRLPTVRGCPIGCSFCQVEHISGKKHRMRSASNVVGELEMLISKYNIKSVNFEDDNAFLNRTRSKEMLHMMIDHKLNLSWKANGVALFTLDNEILSLMAESGCLMINVAVESGNERVLKDIVMKPIDLKKVPGKIALIQKYNIYVCANFIIGMPGETWDEIRETLQYAETCGADYVKIFIANPLVNTKMHKIAKEMNCIVGDENTIDWRYGRIRTSEFTPKDISILRAYEWDRINFTDSEKRKKTAIMMGITVKELNKIRKNTRNSIVHTSLSD